MLQKYGLTMQYLFFTNKISRYYQINLPPLYKHATLRGVAQLGSASALGAEGRTFKSYRPEV